MPHTACIYNYALHVRFILSPLIIGLRLTGGNSCQGRLEIRPPSSTQFGQACDLDAGDNEAMVICRQLGCTAEGAERVSATG